MFHPVEDRTKSAEYSQEKNALQGHLIKQHIIVKYGKNNHKKFQLQLTAYVTTFGTSRKIHFIFPLNHQSYTYFNNYACLSNHKTRNTFPITEQ